MHVPLASDADTSNTFISPRSRVTYPYIMNSEVQEAMNTSFLNESHLFSQQHPYGQLMSRQNVNSTTDILHHLASLQPDPNLARHFFPFYIDTVIEEIWPIYPILPTDKMRELLTKEVKTLKITSSYTNVVDRYVPRTCFLLATGNLLRTYKGEKTFNFELYVWRKDSQPLVDSTIEELLDLAPDFLYQISSASTQRHTYDAMVAACLRAQRKPDGAAWHPQHDAEALILLWCCIMMCWDSGVAPLTQLPSPMMLSAVLNLPIPCHSHLILSRGTEVASSFIKRVLDMKELGKIFYAWQVPFPRYQKLPQPEASDIQNVESILIDMAKCMSYFTAYADARKRSQQDEAQWSMTGAQLCVSKMIEYVDTVQLSESMFKRFITMKRERACIAWIGHGARLGLCDFSHPMRLQEMVTSFMLDETVTHNFTSHDINVQLALKRYLRGANNENGGCVAGGFTEL